MIGEQILAKIAEDEFEWYGLRVMHEDQDYPVGAVLPNSFRWEDGERTTEELDGTSAIHVRGDIRSVERGLSALDSYHRACGGRLVLIAGYHACWGEDDGEIVIREAIRIT